MSRFDYTDDELIVNKVIKMNQDISCATLKDETMNSTRRIADDSIESSKELLKSLGKYDDIKNLSAGSNAYNIERKLKIRPVKETWDSLAEQATNMFPEDITIEDFMTEDEIVSAFEELDEINQKFSKKTSIINKTDLTFLTIAIALQVVKAQVFPYVASKFDYGNSFDSSQRLNHNDKSIERAHRKANNSFRDKHLKNNAKGEWINILYQTVPYDITKGSVDLGINMGGRYHRMHTLGHDPILGWVFGTANILTDCITFNDFQTNRISRIDPVTGSQKMIITPDRISMGKMFAECYENIKADYLNLPAALFAQAQHLKSDKYTKLGLPVPILSSFNEDFANKLYREHYDALCFGRDIKIVGGSFVVSKIIDMIITLLHGLFNTNDEDKELFEVKTRKILLISNSIASTSSIIRTTISKNPKNLDIGGLLNTITRLFMDIRFIVRIKQEFIESDISEKLQVEIDEIDRMFEII